MAQRPIVPKFGNWESEDNIPYTVYFEKARKGKTGGKMINPNDPQENPDMFPLPAQEPPSRARNAPEEPIGRRAVRATIHERRSSREDDDLKQFTEAPTRNDNAGRRGGTGPTHQNQGGHGSGSGRPVRQSAGSEQSIDRSPLHLQHQGKLIGKGSGSPARENKQSCDSSHGTPGRSRMKPVSRADESPDKGAAVPRFGEWDENNPSSADNYTHIFNKVREEKITGSPMVSNMSSDPAYSNRRKQNERDKNKIIGHVLESDSVRYACYPVSTFKEIHKYAGPSLHSLDDEPITILLINWGCHRDLKRILEIGPVARVFVVDSHRPIHLHNLSDLNDRVVVLYTGDDENQADLAYDFDVSALANASDLASDDEIEGDSDSDDENESDGEDEDGDGTRKKRRVSDENETDPVKLFRKLKKEYYYMGTFHGKPSGCLMYELSHFLRKNTNELLWLACVALTDQFVHERLTNERYQAGVMELEQHINSSGNLDAVNSVTLKDGTKVSAPDSSRISYEDEPRLMLLQEWNLFDSMLCSSYMATKLKTWNDNGMKKLMLLLAQMGFSLDECKQKFQYMSIEIKRKMKAMFEHFLPEYGLTDFYYRGFLLLHGYSSKISAADVVYGVTALLESSVESDGSCASKQFGVAYDSLSLNKLEKLETGMQHAIKIQRAILRQGSAAITRKGSIRSGSKFRWVKLEDSADAKLLGYPQALTKFGYFLMDALREKGAKMKPLICVCYTHERNKVLMVGVCGKPRLGAIQGNAFGIAFRNAAEETGAEFFHELFESSWLVLDAISVNSFMIRLTEKLW